MIVRQLCVEGGGWEGAMRYPAEHLGSGTESRGGPITRDTKPHPRLGGGGGIPNICVTAMTTSR